MTSGFRARGTRTITMRGIIFASIALCLVITVLFNASVLTNDSIAAAPTNQHLNEIVVQLTSTNITDRDKLQRKADFIIEHLIKKVTQKIANESDGKVSKKIEDNDDTDFSHLLPLAVIGFPKTGTSTLLHWLPSHKDIVMTRKEECSLVFKDSVRGNVENGWRYKGQGIKGLGDQTVQRNYWTLDKGGDEGLAKLSSLKCPAL